MPQIASAVGLARRLSFPQNNSTSFCLFYNTVVIEAVVVILQAHQPIAFGKLGGAYCVWQTQQQVGNGATSGRRAGLIRKLIGERQDSIRCLLYARSRPVI